MMSRLRAAIAAESADEADLEAGRQVIRIIVLVALVAVAIGLGVGWWIFGG